MTEIFEAVKNANGEVEMVPTTFEKIRRRAFKRAFTSHSAIQNILKAYMETLGWRRINKHKCNTQTIADAIYKKEHKTVLVEIKPQLTGVGEIERGIGQTILYLLEGQYAMLVCFSRWEKLLLKVYQELNHPRLWLLTYNEDGTWRKLLPPTL